MKFYIVTPTFNSLSWLQRCARSVADQVGSGVEVHHHVQDGSSTDGTLTWLAEWQQAYADAPGYTFTYESARDAGMYDAINKAWEKMPADAAVTAHLNSDEQYLPGALKGVSEAFEKHPQAEIVLGTYIIVDANSRYICHRRPVRPARWRSQTVCEIITCSCFHKAESFKRHGIRFNTQYKAIADMVFYRQIVNALPVFCIQPQLITSSFTVTGSNLAWSETSLREWQSEMAAMPWYVSRRHSWAARINNILRLLSNLGCAPPREYRVFMPESNVRVCYVVKSPTPRWGCRTKSHEL